MFSWRIELENQLENHFVRTCECHGLTPATADVAIAILRGECSGLSEAMQFFEVEGEMSATPDVLPCRLCAGEEVEGLSMSSVINGLIGCDVTR